MWVGIYTMENKDTNIDYQKFFSLEDQKWEIVENTFGIIFFVWDLYSLLLMQTVFKTHLKKTNPSYDANSHPKS